jgi:ABC-2 type transport system ATP-binding protein
MCNVIVLTNVSKTYKNRTAIKDVSLKLPLGKIIGIVGENGSGKSTLLKLIAGLLQPTSGSVTVNGETANRRISKVVSYLSEHDSFYSMFTVREALAFQASQFIDFNATKAEEIIMFMKLEPDKKIRDLSKGNRGRLKIALTLAREAPYILMDEPLSGLDPLVRESIVKGMIAYVNILGLRYPLQMIPVLLWELLWKTLWLLIAALPLWTSGQMNDATRETVISCLLVVIFPFVIPWRYMLANYVKKQGNRWR